MSLAVGTRHIGSGHVFFSAPVANVFSDKQAVEWL